MATKRSDITIRIAKEEDAKELLNIYAYYVEHTAITFEYEVPALDDFIERIRETLKNYPYLVALADGKIVGYCYAGKFRTRAAYAWCASTSIYIAEQYHGLGIGRMLYTELERILTKQNVVTVYAGAADPVEEDEFLTRNSEHFHKSVGYTIVAKYHKCGYKFGKWYNLIELEKKLRTHISPPKNFIPFSIMPKDID